MTSKYFFNHIRVFLPESPLVPQVHLFPECAGKGAAARGRWKGWKRNGLILFWDTAVEPGGPCDLTGPLSNSVTLIFSLLLKWQPLAMGLTWKAINKESARCVASVFISSLETRARFLPLTGEESPRVCAGSWCWEEQLLAPAEDGGQPRDWLAGILAGDRAWPLGSPGNVQLPATGSCTGEGRRRLSQTTATYCMDHLS